MAALRSYSSSFLKLSTTRTALVSPSPSKCSGFKAAKNYNPLFSPHSSSSCLPCARLRVPTRKAGRAVVVCSAQADDGSFGGEGFEVDKAVDRVLKDDKSKKIFENLAEKVLQDEESQALLKDFATAAQRVAHAKHDLELINRQERELAEILAAQIADDGSEATASVTENEREVTAAEEELRAAELALVTARAGDSVAQVSRKWANDDMDDDLERVGSGKAAAVSALAGSLASIPFILTNNEVGIGSLLSIGGVIVSCALFGVTYRYILRRDLGNIQLKLGAAAAFSVVRGIGQVDSVLLQVGFPAQGVEEVSLAALSGFEGLFTFGFSAVALDYCLRAGILSPFPSKKAPMS